LSHPRMGHNASFNKERNDGLFWLETAFDLIRFAFFWVEMTRASSGAGLAKVLRTFLGLLFFSLLGTIRPD